MVATIVATADSANARITLTVAGGTPATPFFILRRDSQGVGVVRDTSLGTIVWPGSGSLVIYDYEPRQGDLTDYLLTDGDGAPVATSSLTIPAWGTWVKSPGRPYLNVLVHMEQEAPVVRPARRTVVPIEGATTPIVLSEARAGTSGAMRLACLTAAQSAALDALLASGLTLLLDTAPSWRSPWRYVSVGDVQVERAYGDGSLSLQSAARVYALADLVAVEAPIGLTAVDPGRTYDTLHTLYANYAAMAATNATYLDLATG